MSSVATFPNPYLVAILLVCNTRTGSGAQVLFHYPSSPLIVNDSNAEASSLIEESDDETSTNLDESTSNEDDIYARPGSGNRILHQHTSLKTKLSGEEDDKPLANAQVQQNGSKKQYQTSLFGLAEDGLVSLLSPDRTWHKRKFELGINDLIFVGRPVFVRLDGSWRKRKRQKRPTSVVDADATDTATDNDETSGAEALTNAKMTAAEPTTSGNRSQLTMFHVVFVMNPPPLEHTIRVKDMYDNVIKKFSRALKWEQAHNDYVWKEAERISAVKLSGSARRSLPSTLSREILAESSLAVAISNVYTAISNSRIASVTLSTKVSISMQIPPVTSTSYLPSLTDPPIPPGLWLTTATEIGSANGDSETVESGHAFQLAKHYTLLLKSPPHRIAKDAIEAGGSLAAHLPKFVSSLRPTKSFHKLSVTSQTSLTDIQVLARHLIYWRRAVAIPPLHQKDVYIVSPNADMRKLREATKNYEQQFAPTMPNMPSLPRILHALSGTPRPFGKLIPSTDHKEIYYLALAWLMRNGWVTQLRTFVYVRVDPDVKRAVKESERGAKSMSSGRQKSQKTDSDTGREPAKPKQRPSIGSRPSSEGKRSSDGSWLAHNPRMANLILNPPRASEQESKWLDYIESLLITGLDGPLTITNEDRLELQKCWPLFLKYFNGQVAMETIPVRESIKRKDFWRLLSKLGLDLEHGTGDQALGNKSILVAVRHW